MVYPQSLGQTLGLCCLQHCRPSMLRHMLHALSHRRHSPAQVCPIMDCGFWPISGVLCGCHGPHELHLSPFVDAQTALYCGLFWIHYNDVGLRHKTTKHASYTAVSPCPARRPCLVSCQLLSHGLNWSAHGDDVWCTASGILDEWLTALQPSTWQSKLSNLSYSSNTG